jgi:hypothetical protein
VIIGVSGFSWSGSGAVIDYLMEFENLQIYSPEFIIAYHPDGLHDLDLNLNSSCAKFLSSGVAIPRFRKIANSLLKKPTRSKSKLLIENYLKQITQAKWIGAEQGQELLHNEWLYKNIGLRIRNRIITNLSLEFCWKHKPYPLGIMEYSICPDHFYEHTQNFVNDILRELGLNTEGDIVLNQPFPGNNPLPYMKYFSNSRAIVVDRDPRDVFVFLKYIFPGHSYSVPLQDVNVFCEYFEHMHKNTELLLDSPNVLYLKFEDLVYNYDDTTNSIKSFLKLQSSSTPRKYFIPEESEANTQVYKQLKNSQEIAIIENRLNKYLFDFSKVQRSSNNKKAFDDNPKTRFYTLKK